ncbi:MAG: response regulator, partial [Pseudomonas sp.]
MPSPSLPLLVVEDDAIVRMLIVDVLQELGYCAIEAEDGASALAILQDPSQSLSLMMTDVGLPDLSGKDLALK